MLDPNFKSANFKETEKRGDIEEREYLNLPDLHFFLWCQNKYKINKGIFNTIDHWFYTYGVVPIIHRRIYILTFLDFITKEENYSQHKFVKFGNGGLSRKLNQFIQQTEAGEFMI